MSLCREEERSDGHARLALPCSRAGKKEKSDIDSMRCDDGLLFSSALELSKEKSDHAVQ